MKHWQRKKADWIATTIVIHRNVKFMLAAKGKVKLLGGSIISAGVDGYVRFDGQVACSRGGDFACTPIECKELYEIIF